MPSPDPVPAPLAPCAWMVTTLGNPRAATSFASQTRSWPRPCKAAPASPPSSAATSRAAPPAAHQARGTLGAGDAAPLPAVCGACVSTPIRTSVRSKVKGQGEAVVEASLTDLGVPAESDRSRAFLATEPTGIPTSLESRERAASGGLTDQIELGVDVPLLAGGRRSPSSTLCGSAGEDDEEDAGQLGDRGFLAQHEQAEQQADGGFEGH